MSFETTKSAAGCVVWVVGLMGTSVPTGPRLRGSPRGIGGEATKSKTKGGGATPHACPTKIQLQNTNKKVLKKKHTKETRCKKIQNKRQKKHNTKPTS